MEASGTAPSIEGYLRRIRVRAAVVLTVRALAAVTGAGALAFALTSAIAGPVVAIGWTIAAWVLVLGAAAGAAFEALRPAARLRGSAIARLLAPVRADLASAARSAVELASDARAKALAPDLVAAHARRVGSALAEVPVERVVPLKQTRHPILIGALAAAMVATAILALSERAAGGAWALTHPGARDDGGITIAAVVAGTEARLLFPSYLGRPPLVVRDASVLEAPRGTTVDLAIETRVDGDEGVLEVAGDEIRLRRDPAGRLAGSFVVRDSGDLAIRIRDEAGEWIRDPGQRYVRAIADEAPRVAMLTPETDRTIEQHEDVVVGWDARDDVGLGSIDVVIRTPTGREVRRRVAHFEGGDIEPEAAGSTRLVASELGAMPGDSIVVWIEGRDGDVISGPNVGKSGERTLTIASEATRRAEAIASLTQVLERGLDALADRLEAPVATDARAASERFDRVKGSTTAFREALEDLTGRSDDETGVHDPAIYVEMARRVRRALAKEAAAHRAPIASEPRRKALDTELVEELEADVLLLADTIGRARIDDAAALTRELDELRRQMTSLLAELRRADTPEARQALLGAIARAEARMRELMERLAAMADDVPQDFMNAEALENGQQQLDTLEAMRRAVEQGDLDAAERHLLELQRRIDAIAAALGNTEDAFVEARFGPRERAMAEAMDALSGLESEQRRLADRTTDVRRRAAERALDSAGGRHDEAARRLAQRAREVREGLEGVDPRSLGMIEREAWERARQRMIDVEDALRTGDLAEARRMADEAAPDVEDLARDLDLSALMFPGADGRTGDNARRTRSAVRDLHDLQRGLDEALPNVEDFVDDPGRQQMRGDSPRQGQARQAADRLAEQLAEGPDGTPLSPDGSRAVREAAGAMGEARRALDRGDPVDASRAQEQAARRLTELREQLEREQQQREQQAGGGGGGEGGESAPDFRQPVEIPGAEAFRGPVEMRRRILDAMREGAPRGYEESVRRYYEELLR